MTAEVPARQGEPSTLVLACGALARELLAVTNANEMHQVRIECLPATLHHTPSLIVPALRRRLEAVAHAYRHVLVGYADCGTAGDVDRLCEEFGVVRLPGAHCFEFFAGEATYDSLQTSEPGTFYLTDFLARHFDRFVLDALGITAHPELEQMYFGNYNKMVYLSQVASPELVNRAQSAADRLGLTFEHIPSGYGELEPVMVEFIQRTADAPARTQVDLLIAAGRSPRPPLVGGAVGQVGK